MTIATPVQQDKGIHKYVINQDVLFPDTNIKLVFDNDWLNINEQGDITVKGSNLKANGYAWDGCSPKLDLFNLVLVGIPDGRINLNTGKPFTYYASLVHDALCQFREETGIDRKEADKVFLYYLGDFKVRYVYYLTVRIYSLMSDMIELIRSKAGW